MSRSQAVERYWSTAHGLLLFRQHAYEGRKIAFSKGMLSAYGQEQTLECNGLSPFNSLNRLKAPKLQVDLREAGVAQPIATELVVRLL